MGICINGSKIGGIVINGQKVTGVAINGNVVYKDKPKAKIYGIKRSLTTYSPEWERTDDAINLYAEATHDGKSVRNDFDNIYPWSDIYTYSLNTLTGKETRYDEQGFNYTDDYVMTKFPKFWYKRWQDNDNEYIQIASDEVEGFIKIDEFSLGRYMMSGSSSAVYSKSGESPLASVEITNFRKYAQNIGKGWGQTDWRYFALQILYLVEYANYNSQSVLGLGNVNSGSKSKTGGCDSLGMKSGCLSNNGAGTVIYRGVEDVFGNLSEFIDGININNYKAYVCYDPTKYEINTYSGYYDEIDYTNAKSSNYISKLGYTATHPLISFPIEVNGSSTTGICDEYSQSNGEQGVFVGGYYSDGDEAGLFNWSCNRSSTHTSSHVGARLLKY